MLDSHRWASWSDAVTDAAALGFDMLPEHTAKRLLEVHGIEAPRGVIGHDADDLLERARDAAIPQPFVLKVISPDVVHKSDVGGVVVDMSESELGDELPRMRDRVEQAGFTVSGFLLEQHVDGGVEVVVGAVRDATGRFTLMMGLGGIFIEVMEDVAFRICPVERADITAMIDELQGSAVLRGARGGRAVDLQALADMVWRFAGDGGVLECLPPSIREVDLNPVMAKADAVVALDARFVLDPNPPIVDDLHPPEWDTAHDFGPLFKPDTIAVLGASSKGNNPANLFIRNLRSFGFRGQIHPVHPAAEQIEGLQAYRSLQNLPEPVDYAFVSLPAHAVPQALASADGMVRFAQVISSGFSEIDDGAVLERDLVHAARQSRVRVLGPNCLGTYSPRGSLTFVENADPVPGSVAVISQSGGLSVDILRIGSERGIRFSGIVSVGNGADVAPGELLEHFLRDPETEVVGLYLESMRQAIGVMDVMRRVGSDKPVVLLAGGRTAGGARAAQSHTGALAGNHRLWPALATQSGMVLVDSLSELLNALMVFQFCEKSAAQGNSDVVLFGNGGGTSVLATDSLERASLNVPTLPRPTQDELADLGLPPGTSLANPLDAPAWTLAVDDGRISRAILATVLRTTTPALVISHFNVGIIASNTRSAASDVMTGLIDGVAQARDESPGSHHLLVLRPDGSPATAELIDGYRTQAHQAGLPVFTDLSEAAAAGRALVVHDRRSMVRQES